MSYLRNVWYPAGWARDVGKDQLVARTFLNQPVVLFRDDDHLIHALEDRCPHRFVPLSMGVRQGNAIQCGYHGLTFDCSGACVRNPHGDGAIPKAARVQSYPIVERHGLLWIWMGEPEQAKAEDVPDFSQLDPSSNYVGAGHLMVEANYMLETDNILDLSHIEFLHPGSLGTAQVSQGKIDVEQKGDTVYSIRSTYGEILTPELAAWRGFPPDQQVDRWLNVRWNAPASMLLEAGYVNAGHARSGGLTRYLAHLFTPETESTTHYWFGVALPHDSIKEGQNGQEMADRNLQWLTHPFANEDLPMLKAQQKMMAGRDFWSMKPVLLPSDGAAVRARRILERMIKAEQQGSAHALSA